MERLTFIPNVFYDIIVFVTPALVLSAGIGLGIGFHQTTGWLGGLELSGSTTVLFILSGVFLGYEYGRIAEAWSSLVVQRPLLFLSQSEWPLLDNPDFNRDLDDTVQLLPLSMNDSPGEAPLRGSKWTLYFFALGAAPELGSDLLKRYAWEKLSRSSAFSVALLFVVSVSIGIGDSLDWWFDENAEPWSFGTFELNAALGLLMAFLYVEYFKRNCWNNDLLRKVMPVVVQLAQDARR